MVPIIVAKTAGDVAHERLKTGANWPDGRNDTLDAPSFSRYRTPLLAP